MKRNKLADKIYKTSYIQGRFTLRSGEVASYYFDKYLFESDPKLLKEVATHLAEMVPEGTQILGGLEMGGLPIATALSLKTNTPFVSIRKKPKTYGTKKLVEGVSVRGKNVCLIEDVTTTGGQIVQSALEVRKLGATVKNVLCVIERDKAAVANLGLYDLKLISLFNSSDFNLG